MKIAICASMFFEKEILKLRDKLKKLDYDVIVPFLTEKIVGKEKQDQLKLEKDLIKYYFKKIKKVDAILVPNWNKNNIKNYIGANTLIEMGFAFVLDKKIFLLNPIPEISYKSEIEAMKPIILNGDLSKIK